MTKKTFDIKDLDTSFRPQDDFYHHVSNKWFKRNPIPVTQVAWGSFNVLRLENQKKLRGLLEQLCKKKTLATNSAERKLRDLYLTTMNMAKRTRQGITYLYEGFNIIERMQSKEELAEVLAYLHTIGVGAPWDLYFDQDDKQSKRMVLRLVQSGIGVPDRNYLVKKDKESKRVRDAYIRYVERMLKAEKYYPAKSVGGRVKKIIQIETRLAQASMTPVETRDAKATYNKMSSATLKKKYPAFKWQTYFNAIGVPKKALPHLIINQPLFLKEVNTLIKDISLSDWKTYLRWQYLDTYAGTLGEPYISIRFEYVGRTLLGQQKMPELWKRGIAVCDGVMGEALGKMYVEKYFPPEAWVEIKKLVRNVTKAYEMRITKLDWMSARTKRKAIQKLKSISLLLGHPTKYETYTDLEIGTRSHAQNVLQASIFGFKKEMRRLSKPTDPKKWEMPPQTVNAYYSPNLNQIIFPAGILQPPFFDHMADVAMNYGAIGSIIGHELTHGFDDQGAKFDKDGNMNDWWTKEDYAKFRRKTKVLEEQFNKYKVVDGVRVNGKLTLGENIADLGGLVIAYDALQLLKKGKHRKKINGLTMEQRYFIGFAIGEKMQYRDEFLKLITLTDPHAPNEFRVNGPASNVQAFYDAFDVKQGDALYRKKSERAKIW